VWCHGPALGCDDHARQTLEALGIDGLVAGEGVVDDRLALRGGHDAPAQADERPAGHLVDGCVMDGPRGSTWTTSPLRAPTISMTEPICAVGTSMTSSSTGSQRTPSTSFSITRGLPT